jgi:ABC-type branched-subunit amino acid transport system permease subunit
MRVQISRAREVLVMFELFQLVLSSPLGAYVVAGLQDALYAVIVAADCEECGFNDLGTLLFGGVLAAVIVGVAISVVLRRMKENTPGAARFVSIRSSDKK